MRFMHTSDWHLGRLFHGVHLTDDQRFTLDALVCAAGEAEVDAVVISGDIYDRAVPPTEAVTLLNDILGKLTLELKIPVVMIAGNHDSPIRIDYMSGLVGRMGLHVVGPVGAEPTGVSLTAKDGTVTTFWLLAYTDPETARCELSNPDIHTHEAALAAQIALIRGRIDSAHNNVIVGHAFVTGAEESESERPLSVGGTGEVSSSVFDGFDYVALGHLHRPQKVTPNVRYSGSLLKYSFSETEHAKSVALVELRKGADPVITTIELPIRRDLVSLRGTFDELTTDPKHLRHAQAYVEVRLVDATSILDPMERLRAVYPNILNLRREGEYVGEFEGPAASAKTRTPEELFGAFFEDVTGDQITDAQRAVLADVLAQLDRVRREVAL